MPRPQPLPPPPNQLHVFRSSAGSGKTFRLALEYLKRALQYPTAYRHILAVTFTRKATAEMKARILNTLWDIVLGNDTPLVSQLRQELNTPDLTERARAVFDNLLHEYHRLGIQTLDSFFSGVVQAFAHELDRPFVHELELDLKPAEQFAAAGVLEKLGSEAFKEQTTWLASYLSQRMEEGKRLHVDRELGRLAREFFGDAYASLFKNGAPDAAHIRALTQQLHALSKQFEQQYLALGQQAVALMAEHGLTLDDFKYYSPSKDTGGFGKLFQNLKNGSIPDKWTQLKGMIDGDWAKKKNDPAVEAARAAGLQQLAEQAIRLYDQQYPAYQAAKRALLLIHVLPLMGELEAQLATYRQEQHVLLQADVTALLSEIVASSTAPFIYEKVGTRYEHYLIDEFQDTARQQLLNLQPLLQEALAQGQSVLVVGDAKQSIYRWRGGDMRLLLQLHEYFPQQQELLRVDQLSTNYRSLGHIVAFNNALFPALSSLVQQSLLDIAPEAELIKHLPLFDAVYSPEAVTQTVKPGLEDQGYVQIQLINTKSLDKDESETWKTEAEAQTLELLQALRKQGYAWQDMALLVRGNTNGQRLAQLLQNAQPAPIPVITEKALELAGSPEVQLLTNILRALEHTSTARQQALLIAYSRLYASLGSGQLPAPEALAVRREDSPALLEALLGRSRAYLRQLPLQELVGYLIRQLGFAQHADAYLLAFQDKLQEFSQRHSPELSAFLEWWDEKGSSESVASPAGADAVRIMTIHKAKGLQFPVVIIPFADWSITPSSRGGTDQASLIWAQANAEPYGDMALPIQPQSKVPAEDPFAAALTEELVQTLLDNLNLLYVALTRPERQLYLFAKQQLPSSGTPSTTSHLLTLAVQELTTLGLEPSEHPTGQRWQLGSPVPPTKQKDKPQEAELHPLAYRRLPSWNDVLTIRRRAANFPRLLGAGWTGPIAQGELMHAILAQVVTTKDLPAALQHAVLQGLLPPEALPEIEAKLTALLTRKDIHPWFDGSYQVYNEQEVLLPATQRVLRPDRLMQRHGLWTVLDYKTGLPHPSHQRQVHRYMQAVALASSSMAYGYLLYLDSGTLVEVTGQGTLF